MQSLECGISHMRIQQNEEVIDCVALTSTGNCDVVDANDKYISEEEGKRRRKRNRRGKKKSKARDSDNEYVVTNTRHGLLGWGAINDVVG